MKITIYFNYCKEGSIELINRTFNIKNTFNVNIEKDTLYFYSKNQYFTIKNMKKYINSIEFNNIPYHRIEIGWKISGSLPEDIDIISFINKEEG